MAVRKPLLRDIEVHPDFKKRPQKIFQKFQKFYSEKSEQHVSCSKQLVNKLKRNVYEDFI